MNRNLISLTKSGNTIVYLIAVGFFSILGQVVILRELNVAFYGIELIYILSFAFWMIGTAIGAAIGHRSYIPSEKNIHKLFLISSCLLIVDVAFIRSIRNLLGGVQGAYLPFLIQMVGLIIALLPIGFLAGLLFQFTTKRFIEKNETLAKAYAIESIGGVLGGLGSTLFLNFGISNFSISIICSLSFVFIVIYYSLNPENKSMKWASIVFAAGILMLFGFANQIDMLMTSWNHPYMIESIDTPYNRVTVTSPENQICVFEDDALSYETQSISAEEFVQISTLQTTNIRNVLVLGGGFTGIISELLKLPVQKIDYVEINKDLIGVLQKHLPDELKKSIYDKKVNIIYDDPRGFLEGQHLYDVILVGMPEPTSAQNNRFYTKEFFERCFNSMHNDGLLAFKILSSENIWTQQLTNRNSGINNALKSAFRNVLVLPGAANIFIASKSDLTADIETLINRFNERNLETKLVSPQYIQYIYTNDRFKEIQKLLSTKTQNINSDMMPTCYSYTISIWLSKFFPDLAYSENPLFVIDDLRKSPIIYLILIMFLGVILLIRKSAEVKRFTIILLAGLIGMTLEILLILLYQNKNGILFRDIGVLLMMFMVGLAVGSLFVNRLFVRIKNRFDLCVWLGISLVVGFTLLNAVVYFLIKIDLVTSLVLVSALLLLDGLFVAGIFSFSSLYKVKDQKAQITRLYSADLIGGSLGALMASLVLIPVYGFYASLIFLIALSILCFSFF